MKYLLCILPVAKRSSVFDDPTTEIQELTAVIKQDITALNSAVVDLQFVCNSQNESANISTDTTTHSATVVDNLKNRLMSATKEFKEVLTMRTEVHQLSHFCIASVLAVYGIIVALLLELFFSVLLLWVTNSWAFWVQNLKVHENRRQLFSATSSKDAANPFVRQRPLASRSAASTSASPPPWANESASQSQLFPR